MSKNDLIINAAIVAGGVLLSAAVLVFFDRAETLFPQPKPAASLSATEPGVFKPITPAPVKESATPANRTTIASPAAKPPQVPKLETPPSDAPQGESASLNIPALSDAEFRDLSPQERLQYEKTVQTLQQVMQQVQSLEQENTRLERQVKNSTQQNELLGEKMESIRSVVGDAR